MTTVKTILWLISMFSICVTIIFMILTINNLTRPPRFTDEGFKLTNRSSGGIEGRLYSFKKMLNNFIGTFRAFHRKSVHEKSDNSHTNRGDSSND